MRSALEKLSLEQRARWTGGLGKVGTSIPVSCDCLTQVIFSQGGLLCPQYWQRAKVEGRA